MNILNVFYTVLISPLEMLIETVFCFELNKIGIFGAAGAIAAVSLAVSFLTLPIYNAADAIQQRERDTAARLAHWALHIRRHFSGDERFMMLSYYYKQNNYHPLYALRSSLSIMIEVPFFIAAYHFLSHCPALQGASCGLLRDLGKPDGLIAIGAGGGRSLTFNVLPILMTAINAASSAVYLKGFTLREKAQTYCLAGIFLILLYNSPSGLVLYWMLNNAFSLAKNAVQRWMKEPWRAAHGCTAAMFIAVPLYRLLQTGRERTVAKWATVLVCAVLYALLPVWRRVYKTWIEHRWQEAGATQAVRNHNDGGLPLFLVSAAALALLLGLVLPASSIATSPAEFCFIGGVDNQLYNPLYYVRHSVCVFAGMCVFWPLAIYKMMGERVKRVMPYLAAFALAVALLNVYAFGFNYGTMNIFFRLDNSDVLRQYSVFYTLLPIIAAVLCAALLAVAARHKTGFAKCIFIFAVGGCIAECALGAVRVQHIRASYNKFAVQDSTQNSTIESEAQLPKVYHLSKTGKNVVVLFMDNAAGQFFPYIVREFPQLANEFDGFVYYPNTVSFSNCTLKASPAMMGGYEYTPEAMNKREDVLLREKHYEASLLMPRIFSDARWSVTVSDVPLWVASDMSAFFDKYNIPLLRHKDYRKAYLNQIGEGEDDFWNSTGLSLSIYSNIMAFSFMQASLPSMRHFLYDGGHYFMYSNIYKYGDLHHALGEYSYMYYLDSLTDAISSNNTFTFIGTEVPHNSAFLCKDDYHLSDKVSDKDIPSSTYSGYDGNSDVDLEFYHVNAASMLLVAKWLDKLRELGVYDNTRIIIVADHGCYAGILTPAFVDRDNAREIVGYNPLLLVKDFDAHGQVRQDNTFMTNADTPSLAKAGLPISNINPFTLSVITTPLNKKDVRIYGVEERPGFTERNGTYMLNKTTWQLDNFTGRYHAYSVHDNIFDEHNWRRLE